jgi:predicted Zn-ribbon and HTH transcriptional regulator
MHYNWKVYGRYKCPKCGWNLARKRADHEKAVSLCCRCKTKMVEIDPKTLKEIKKQKG